jgi:GNAT superfamily N-acetyltransferase
MKVSVRNLEANERALRPFLELPSQIYRNDPDYCVPFRDSVLAGISRQSFDGRQQVMIAEDRGRTVARVVARVSPVLRDDDGDPIGMLGFFESENDPAGVGELFRTAIGWLRSRGAGTIVGPMNGDTWHSYRLSVGPREERPFMMEPYNPAYYPDLWEANGFTVLEQYYSLRIDDLAASVQRLEPMHRRVLESGYRLEKLRIERFDRELERFYELCCNIFRGNFLYSEISRERFVELYSGARQLVDPDLICFAVASDGEDAGFLFAMPDRFRALAAMRGSKGPMAKLRFLALRNRTDTVNLKSLGVLEGHRRYGIGSALMYQGYKTSMDKGYRKANMCLILEDNPSGTLHGGRKNLLRRYHLYKWTEDPAS